MFAPYVGEATKNPFFMPNRETGEKCLDPHSRESTLLIPDHFTHLYDAYPENVEFHNVANGIVLMSISEIERRTQHLPKGCVDFGFRYAGMGHVRVFTFLRERGEIVECIDGGADDIARTDNMDARHRLLRDFIQTGDAPAQLRVFSVDGWLDQNSTPR